MNTREFVNKYNETIKLITTAKKITVLTGAGISTESGLPDFRSKDGFWTKNKPIQFQDYLDNEEQQRQLLSLISKIANIAFVTTIKDYKVISGSQGY